MCIDCMVENHKRSLRRMIDDVISLELKSERSTADVRPLSDIIKMNLVRSMDLLDRLAAQERMADERCIERAQDLKADRS